MSESSNQQFRGVFALPRFSCSSPTRLRLRCRAFGLLALLTLCWSGSGRAAPLDIAAIDPAPFGSAPLLSAMPGVTGIAGRVLGVDGRPLAGVVVSEGAVRSQTDLQGRYLLTGLPAGIGIVALDGRHGRAPGQSETDYGYYEMQVQADASRTTHLPYVNWLTPLDHAHEIVIDVPTKKPVVVRTPAIPGLELRIPAGAVLTDPDHKPVTHVGLTEISVRRPPFPLPKNVNVPVYFTAQPGGAVISSADGTWLGAQIVYPNYRHLLPRARSTFWRYDPDSNGWAPYGVGTVTADGRQVVPDKDTRIYSLSGAMICIAGLFCPPPCLFTTLCLHLWGPSGADPVDLGGGSFSQVHTDMRVEDVLPISATRLYSSAETTAHSFGAGMSSAYDISLWSDDNYNTASLILPGGKSVPYTVVQGGQGDLFPWESAVYSTTTPGPYYQSVLRWNFAQAGWIITKRDGTMLFFDDFAPLRLIQDKFGNKITITRDGNGNITQVTSPNGKFINFGITNNVVTSATDNLGRTFTYGYDSNYTMLQTIKDPDGGTTTYGWTNGQITSITDPRGNAFITNTYDSNLRVKTQTLANGTSKYGFTFTLGTTCQTSGTGQSECNVLKTDLVDPNGNTRELTWDANAMALTDKWALGSSAEIDMTYCISGDAGLNASSCPAIANVPAGYMSDMIDGLSRDTHYSYDASGNATGVTYLYGTSAPATYGFTYSPSYSLLSSVTDPNNHTFTWTRPEPLEEATQVTDALGHSTSYAYNPQGQMVTATDALSPANTTTLAYDHGDLASVTDPLGRITQLGSDAAGRPFQVSDPLKNTWQLSWDPIDGIHQTIDPLSAATTTNFDADGNVGSIVDALNHSTSYTYTTQDQLLTSTDPKSLEEQYTQYDPTGNLKTWIDRKGQTATYAYDALNRISKATYADGSNITYSWDKGNRLTQISDTLGNTISRFYDGLNNLICETPVALSQSQLSTCQGETAKTVVYTYDAASRRQTMTVSGQGKITYTYDAANRLTNIAQAANGAQSAASVVKTYDNDNRPYLLTLPDGIVATYSFDAASELESITYAKGSSTVGNLTYTYDSDGRVATKGGSLFQSVMPTAVVGAAYDADNRLCAWNVASPSCSSPSLNWDSNGNLTYYGGATLTWDARNRLTAVSGLNLGFTYDALDRRLTQTSGGTITSYVYDFENVVQELQSGAASANLLTGLNTDERFSRTAAGSTATSFLTDNLGSVLALANSTGAIATSYSYTAFGATAESGTTDTNSYGFTGRENSLNDFYYNRARYYSPLIDRFISEDPIGFGGGVNKYAYAGNDPISSRDPSGLWQVTISGGWIIAGAITFGCNGGQWNAGFVAGMGEGADISVDSTDSGASADTGLDWVASGAVGAQAQLGSGFGLGAEASGTVDLGGEQQSGSIDASAGAAGVSANQGYDFTHDTLQPQLSSITPNSGEYGLGESAYAGVGDKYTSQGGHNCGQDPPKQPAPGVPPSPIPGTPRRPSSPPKTSGPGVTPPAGPWSK